MFQELEIMGQLAAGTSETAVSFMGLHCTGLLLCDFL